MNLSSNALDATPAGAHVELRTTASQLPDEFTAKHATVIQAGFKGFEICCFRHSALTMLAEAGCDAFTLARIAGYSSITITQRYCHSQADAIERAFGKLAGGHKIGNTAQFLEGSGREWLSY